MDLPAPLLDRARRARLAVEVGAGDRFDVALALRAANPAARWVVTDVDPRVLAAPAGLEARVLDAASPSAADLAALEGADLVYAVRVPEELQVPCARLAARLGADLALRPLKDEWADLSAVRRRSVAWGLGWRCFRA